MFLRRHQVMQDESYLGIMMLGFFLLARLCLGHREQTEKQQQ
jgi:hypothetical protein